MTSPRFRRLPLQLRPLVDNFYRDHRSPMRSQAGDELWVTESASEIVAALSLRPVAGGQWLTGLFVAPRAAAPRRGSGIAQSQPGATSRASLAVLSPRAAHLLSAPGLRGLSKPADRAGRATDPLSAQQIACLAAYPLSSLSPRAKILALCSGMPLAISGQSSACLFHNNEKKRYGYPDCSFAEAPAQ